MYIFIHTYLFYLLIIVYRLIMYCLGLFFCFHWSIHPCTRPLGWTAIRCVVRFFSVEFVRIGKKWNDGCDPKCPTVLGSCLCFSCNKKHCMISEAHQLNSSWLKIIAIVNRHGGKPVKSSEDISMMLKSYVLSALCTLVSWELLFP